MAGAMSLVCVGAVSGTITYGRWSFMKHLATYAKPVCRNRGISTNLAGSTGLNSTRKQASRLLALFCLTLCIGIADARDHYRFDAQDFSNAPLGQEQALSLYFPEQRKATFDACRDQFPGQRPLEITTFPRSMRALALCSDHFAVLYSQTSKTPLVVIERLNSEQLHDAKDGVRTNQFYADPRIPRDARAELHDYRSQDPQVDRGHQAPAADAPDQRSMAQSFALSNMVPQDPINNRKIWSKVEFDVRKFALRAHGNVFVFTGPLFGQGYTTVGNNVWKPTHLFKLVYDETSGRARAYVLPNAETPIERAIDYPTFVSITGLQLLANVDITGTIRFQK